jgi:hypothetical protein
MQRIAQATASSKSIDEKKKEAARIQKEKEKAAAEQAKKEAAELFKPVQVQKVPFGVDPKTVLCQFFKAGNCEKGELHDVDACEIFLNAVRQKMQVQP